MSFSKLGSPIPVSAGVSCKTCALRDRCTNPKKSRHFACSFFIEQATRGLDPSNVAFNDLMRELVKSETILANPYGIDDRDAPLAPNYHAWCTGEEFLAADPRPYPWQIEAGLHLFNEICPNPRCSDPKWFNRIPHDCDVMEIPERLSLRNNGWCPKCGKSRLDYFRAHREKDYNSLVLVIGQRSGKCVVGSTLVQTTRGLKRIDEIEVGDYVVVYRKAHRVLGVKRSISKPVIKVTTRRGYSITCTPDHPLLTPEAFIQARFCESLQVCSHVEIFPSCSPPGASAATELHARARDTAEFLSLCNEEDAKRLIHASVVDEVISNNPVGIVVIFKSERIAAGVQEFLLTKGVIARRWSNQPALLLEHPWVMHYANIIGFKNPNIDQHARMLERASSQVIDQHACRVLAAALSKIVPTQWYNPAAVQVAAFARANALSNTLTRSASMEAATALRKMLVDSDDFLKHLAIDALETAASTDYVWDDVVSREKMPRESVYDIEVEGAHRFVGGGITAHNSVGLALISTYHDHMLLKLRNPSQFYGIKAGTILQSTIVGLTFSNAKQYVFEPYLASIADSPWHKTYHAILKDVAQRRGEEDLFTINSLFVYYRPAGLRIAPASPDRRNLRGATRVKFIFDEMGQFSSDNVKVRVSGSEIWRSLVRSLSTVRPAVRRLREQGIVNIPQALAASISSPWEVGDPIMSLYNAAPKLSGFFTMKRPTWKANPTIKFADLADDFSLDPASAWRDYGCRPPYSVAAFVRNIDPFKMVIRGKDLPAVRQKTIPIRKDGEVVAVTAALRFRWTNDSIPTLMTIDPGAVKNSFAIAVSHLDSDERLVYDAFVEVRPREKAGVSFERIYKQVMLPLIDRLNVRVVVGDRWQHLKIADDLLADRDIEYVPIRLVYAQFLAWRDDLMRGFLRLPRPEATMQEITKIEGDELSIFDDRPVAGFIRQCLRVVDEPGDTVSKPSSGNDDLFRVGVLAHAAITIPDITDLLLAGDMDKRGWGYVGVASLGSQGTSGVSEVHKSSVAAATTSMLGQSTRLLIDRSKPSKRWGDHI